MISIYRYILTTKESPGMYGNWTLLLELKNDRSNGLNVYLRSITLTKSSLLSPNMQKVQSQTASNTDIYKELSSQITSYQISVAILSTMVFVITVLFTLMYFHVRGTAKNYVQLLNSKKLKISEKFHGYPL